MTKIEDNCRKVHQTFERVLEENYRSNKEATIIAVTKYTTPEVMEILLQQGFYHFGENRVDVFLEKKKLFSHKKIVWHFIGNLQTKKVKKVINELDYFHALDSLKLAEEIEKRATHKIKCFLEVNISKEKSKHGFTEEQIYEVIETFQHYEKLEIVGLMTMAPYTADEFELQHIFSSLRNLQEEIKGKNITNVPCTQLSMGMSRDFSIALAQGATFVRIGSAFYENSKEERDVIPR